MIKNMDSYNKENIVLRRINKNDRELFVDLRITFLLDCFDAINDTDDNEKGMGLKLNDGS
jgi:hypothetical protein